MATLLDVKQVAISYGKHENIVADITFSLAPGEVLAIVGESGSGKTTVIRSLIGCLASGGKVTTGTITYDGIDLQNLSPKEWRKCRGKEISMIFQDSGNALNPLQKIGKQFIAYLRCHEEMSETVAYEKAVALCESVSLPNGVEILNRYPFELSGGQRQRLGIAMAMAFSPKLLLADEPTSALDVTTQAQIVAELMRLAKEKGTAIILVTHNIGVAAYMADKIVVMQQGRIVDSGTRDEVLYTPKAAYTASLLAAVPELGGRRYVEV